MVTQLRDATRTARKVHRCSLCNIVIPVGTEHRVSTNIYDGRVYDWRTCKACDDDGIVSEVHWWAGFPDEGVNYEQAHEWAHEHRNTDPVGVLARAWLRRNGCTCETCEDEGTRRG